MAEIRQQTAEQQQETGVSSAPWYALHPKHLKLTRRTWVLLGILFALLVVSEVTVKPLWKLGWSLRLYNRAEFFTQRSVSHTPYRGGTWMKQKTIYVYAAPGVDARCTAISANGLRRIIDEVGLDLRVEEQMPDRVAESLAYATVRRGRLPFFDFDRYCSHRLDMRGMAYGELLIVNDTFADPDWAWGLTSFACGLTVLQQSMVTEDLARHEGVHLLGYMSHDDDRPRWIVGYREALLPSTRQTLMMLSPTKDQTLSLRARDALFALWRSLEKRDRISYRATAVPAATPHGSAPH